MRNAADNVRDLLVGKLGVSRILATLGPEWFAEFPAIHTTGHVVWCNFELARTLGFDVPSSNRMTPRFHRQLIAALSYRAVRATKGVAGRAMMTLYADRYGGEGLGPALGAGRSGFLPFGNLYIKGVGITPLFRHDDPDDLPHSHGGLQMDHCLGEAVFGEVNHHLFTHGSSRILAIIDQGESVVYRRGRNVALALAVRSGGQLRPGHLLTGRVRRRSILEAFIRITKETAQLVTRHDAGTGLDIPDIKKTMIRVIDDHARTTAEQFRWRMIHGAVTSSNMDMSGAMLDLTTQSAQPRTAPVCFRHDYGSFFGYEHIDCATELKASYVVLVKSIPPHERRRLNARPLNFVREMNRAYAHHLQAQLLGATGLKPEVAARIRAEHPDLARRFTATITAMCHLRNPGRVEMARRVVEHIGVLDVFNLFREYPGRLFAHPRAAHTRFIRDALKPIFRGNRFHIAKTRTAVKALIKQCDVTYRELMSTSAAYARGYYGDAASMRASIASRAAFENEPIRLYRSALYQEFEEAIVAYRSTGDVEMLRAMIERKLSASLRNVEALLRQGGSRRPSDGGCELEVRTIDGIEYSIRAWNDRKQRRSLRVSVPVERRGRDVEIQLPGWPRLTTRHLGALRYRFTTDGWVTARTRAAHLEEQPDGRCAIVCEGIPAVPLIGKLEGVFCLLESRGSWFAHEGATSAGYTYAVPDQHDLARHEGKHEGHERRTRRARRKSGGG